MPHLACEVVRAWFVVEESVEGETLAAFSVCREMEEVSDEARDALAACRDRDCRSCIGHHGGPE
jgi:hypothetical protein